MKAVSTLGLAAALAVSVMAQAPAPAAAPCRGTEGRRHGSRLHASGDRRQDLQAVVLQGQAGRGAGLVPEGVHARLHDRVQVARGRQREAEDVRRRLLHGERRSDRRRAGQQGVRRVAGRRLPAAERHRARKPRRPTAC